MKQRIKRLEHKMRRRKKELLIVEHNGRYTCGGREYTAEEVRQLAARQPVVIVNLDIDGVDGKVN